MYYPAPKFENVPLSDLPLYTGGYQHCRVAHTDPNTKITTEQMVSNEDAGLLRKLYHIHKKGLEIQGHSFLERAYTLEYKGLVSKRSGRFYITPKATQCDYTLVPRIVPIDSDQDP
ncbi:MAG TPA: hypothetical protein VJB13_04375 [Candidatus Nanoarchaeia archaeon]|nr:hypothetical protein [Candidatus Nanoarchaeia archaeon]